MNEKIEVVEYRIDRKTQERIKSKSLKFPTKLISVPRKGDLIECYEGDCFMVNQVIFSTRGLCLSLSGPLALVTSIGFDPALREQYES